MECSLIISYFVFFLLISSRLCIHPFRKTSIPFPGMLLEEVSKEMCQFKRIYSCKSDVQQPAHLIWTFFYFYGQFSAPF